MNEYPQELVESVVESNFVPFIGAGISIPSGVPSWDALLTQLIEQLGNGPLEKDFRARYHSGQLAAVDLPAIFDLLKGSTFSRLNFLVSKFNRPFRPNRYHHLLRNFALGTIVTTNYERLIETSFEEANRTCNAIVRDSDLRFYNEAKAVQIIKMHGSILDPESCVLSKTEYDNHARTRRLIYGLVETLLSLKTVLFLGFGFADPNVDSLLRTLKCVNGGSPREHFAVLYEPSRDIVEKVREYGIRPIILSGLSIDDSMFGWLIGLWDRTRSTSAGHRSKADAYLKAIQRQRAYGLPGDVVRMRASQGIISMPKALNPALVLYEGEQDKVEIDLGNTLREFLMANPKNQYRTIVHVDTTIQRQKGFTSESIALRLRAMLEFLDDFPNQIRIAHSLVPIYFNHLIVHDTVSFLSHKRQRKHGPGVTRRTANRFVIQSEIDAFEDDFEAIRDQNLSAAVLLSIDPKCPHWDVHYSKVMMWRQIELLGRVKLVLGCDEDGRVETSVNRAEAHEKGMWHRSVHLHVLKKQPDATVSVLIQERSATTDLYPSRLDVSVAGHAETQDFSAEVLREAAEELGVWFDRRHVHHAFSYTRKAANDHEFVDVFVVGWEDSRDVEGRSLSEDVAALYWANVEALSSGMTEIEVAGIKRVGQLNMPLRTQLPKVTFIESAIPEIGRVWHWLTKNHGLVFPTQTT